MNYLYSIESIIVCLLQTKKVSREIILYNYPDVFVPAIGREQYTTKFLWIAVFQKIKSQKKEPVFNSKKQIHSEQLFKEFN